MAVAVAVMVAWLFGMVVYGGGVHVYTHQALPISSVTRVMMAKSPCHCRVMCQTLPSCTAATIHHNNTGVVCSLSSETDPRPLLTLHNSSLTIIISNHHPTTCITNSTAHPLHTTFLTNAPSNNTKPTTSPSYTTIHATSNTTTDPATTTPYHTISTSAPTSPTSTITPPQTSAHTALASDTTTATQFPDATSLPSATTQSSDPTTSAPATTTPNTNTLSPATTTLASATTPNTTTTAPTLPTTSTTTIPATNTTPTKTTTSTTSKTTTSTITTTSTPSTTITTTTTPTTTPTPATTTTTSTPTTTTTTSTPTTTTITTTPTTTTTTTTTPTTTTTTPTPTTTTTTPTTTTTTTTTTTAEALNVVAFVSSGTTTDGSKASIENICKAEDGFPASLTTQEYVDQLLASDDDDGDKDIDTHGIWIYLNYDASSGKHRLYDGTFLENTEVINTLAITGLGDCCRLLADNDLTKRSCNSVGGYAVACAKIVPEESGGINLGIVLGK